MSSFAISPKTAPAALGPRVLVVIPGEEVHLGSSMIFARRQAAEVASIGVDVRIFFLRSRTSVRTLWFEFRRFREVLAEHQPEVVHAHFGTVTSAFCVACSGTVPVVITYRGSDLNPVPSGSSLRSLAGRMLSQFSAPFASSIVCVSEQLKRRLWWARDRVTVLPSGVDLDTFAPLSRTSARQRLGWPEDEPVILFNAGHDPINKRLDLAEAAVAVARESLPNLRMEVLAGKTDPSSVPLLMNGADCLLVTSNSEGSPTVVQEALSTNLPVVSVEVGDVPERLYGVRHTRVVGRDVKVLAQAIVELVRVPLRSDGRTRTSEFSAHHIAEELCRIYGRIRESARRA